MAGIEYARHIQSALLPLPPQSYLDHLLPDYFLFFQPKDIVSGDYYWVYPKGKTFYIAVADCTGHGIPGAFMSLLGLTLMNEVVNEVVPNDPGKFLTRLRDKIIQSLHQREESYTRDGIEVSLRILDFEI